MPEPAEPGRRWLVRSEGFADGDRHWVVRLGAAPGARATTIGRLVFVRRGAALGPRLHRHEVEHVRQYAQLGVVGFLRRYLAEYIRWRLRGWGHDGAYRRIRYEVAAEWRARRELGIGVVRTSLSQRSE